MARAGSTSCPFSAGHTLEQPKFACDDGDVSTDESCAEGRKSSEKSQGSSTTDDVSPNQTNQDTTRKCPFSGQLYRANDGPDKETEEINGTCPFSSTSSTKASDNKIGICPITNIIATDQTPTEKCPYSQNGGNMRAVRCGGVSESLADLTLETVPVPTPADDEVLVRIFTIGVSQLDVWRVRGFSLFGSHKTDLLPITLGTDAAGVVEKTGKDVKKFQGGERVYLSGAVQGSFAEFALAKECHTHHLHGSMTFSQGAALGVPYHTAYRALFVVGKVKPGQDILIHGASGAVGLACCQLASAHGVRVVATAGSERGCELVLANGALIARNHNTDSCESYLMAVTREQGYHAIFEMRADKNLACDARLVRPKGAIVIIGLPDNIQNVDICPLLFKEARILTVNHFNSTKEESEECYAAISCGIKQGWLRPVIGNEYPLSDVRDALKEVTEHPTGSRGKIILSLN